MTENQFKVLRAMTSEIGLMLAERIFRALSLHLVDVPLALATRDSGIKIPAASGRRRRRKTPNPSNHFTPKTLSILQKNTEQPENTQQMGKRKLFMHLF